jgi:hypothetical protein
MASRTPTSELLEDILHDLPAGSITPDWLLARLGERSFGLLFLVLGVVGLVPGASIVAGLLMLAPAGQMLAGRGRPRFPSRLANRRIGSIPLARLLRRLLPGLRRLEGLVQPRWATPVGATQRGVGGVVLLLSLSLLLPIPLSNLLPAAIIVLIAFAYIEEDGLLLLVGSVLGLLALLVGGVVLWRSLGAAGGWAGLL